jgi:hypothetical protein
MNFSAQIIRAQSVEGSDWLSEVLPTRGFPSIASRARLRYSFCSVVVGKDFKMVEGEHQPIRIELTVLNFYCRGECFKDMKNHYSF